jgi:hypothetical protein
MRILEYNNDNNNNNNNNSLVICENNFVISSGSGGDGISNGDTIYSVLQNSSMVQNNPVICGGNSDNNNLVALETNFVIPGCSYREIHFAV